MLQAIIAKGNCLRVCVLEMFTASTTRCKISDSVEFGSTESGSKKQRIRRSDKSFVASGRPSNDEKRRSSKNGNCYRRK